MAENRMPCSTSPMPGRTPPTRAPVRAGSGIIGRFITLFVVLAFVAPAAGAGTRCDQLFAGGTPPALLNSKLAERTTLLCNDAYAALASGVTRGPLWSAERLTPGELAEADGMLRSGRFHPDRRLPRGERAELADYVRSGYDRGHMAPSGDMPDRRAQQQSFSLANVVPQTPELNRGLWEGVESVVRRLAERGGELFVVTGPLFQGTELQAIGPHNVLVPSATWKALYDPGVGGAGAYVCRNGRQPTCVTLSIAELGQLTGIDPFPAVPQRVKAAATALPPPEDSPYSRDAHRRRHAPHLPDPTLR